MANGFSSDSPEPPILQTENVSRVVNGKTLVQAISIDVWRGEVLAITGPSGAGKSSFLRLLNRLDEPTDGTVRIDGQDYRTIHPQDVRRRVGMVLQAPFLFPGTVAENIRFGPQQRGKILEIERVDHLLNQVGLLGYTNRDVHTLSGGEAQRVSLVRTLANNPDVLLIDEPTSALDDASEQAVEALVLSIVQQHRIACLMITHDQEQVARIANRMMVIEQGRMIQNDPVVSTQRQKNGS